MWMGCDWMDVNGVMRVKSRALAVGSLEGDKGCEGDQAVVSVM